MFSLIQQVSSLKGCCSCMVACQTWAMGSSDALSTSKWNAFRYTNELLLCATNAKCWLTVHRLGTPILKAVITYATQWNSSAQLSYSNVPCEKKKVNSTKFQKVWQCSSLNIHCCPLKSTGKWCPNVFAVTPISWCQTVCKDSKQPAFCRNVPPLCLA